MDRRNREWRRATHGRIDEDAIILFVFILNDTPVNHVVLIRAAPRLENDRTGDMGGAHKMAEPPT